MTQNSGANIPFPILKSPHQTMAITRSEKKLKFRLVTVIWGRDFSDIFLRIGLRSLLADGNLLDLARAHQVAYTIYTTPEDARAIESSSTFIKLRSQVDVRFSYFTTGEIDSGHYGSHNILWQRGLELARRNGQILFFIIPDLIYARGTLLRWARKFEQNYKAIYTPGPQVVLETIVPEIERRFPTHSPVVSIGSEEIAGLMLRHLHPMHCGMMRNSPRRVGFPEYDIRPVSGRGVVLREVIAQPFCLDPSYFGELVHFSPAHDLDAIAIEPCSTLSVEPLWKRVEWYYRPWKLDDRRISQLGSLLNYFWTPGCCRDSETAHRYCLTNDMIWQVESARATAGGRVFRAQLVATLRIYRVIMALQQHGAGRAAGFLAAALYAAKLRKRMRIRAGAVLLVPRDEAFAADSGEAVCALLVPGREKEFIDLILDHVLPAEGTEGGAFKCTARGLPFASVAGSSEVLSGPHLVDDLKFYIIDRVLWRHGTALTPITDDRDGSGCSDPIANETSASPVIAESAVIATNAMSLPLSSIFVSIWGYPAWSKQNLAHKAFYLAVNVPIIEFAVGLVIPVYFQDGIRSFRDRIYCFLTHLLFGSSRMLNNDLRAAFGRARRWSINALGCIVEFVAHIPILGSSAPVQLAGRVVRYVRAHGVRATIQRAVVALKQNRRMRLVVCIWMSKGEADSYRWIKALRYARTHGLRATAKRAKDSVIHRWRAARNSTNVTHFANVPEPAVATLGAVRLLRGLLAMESILDYYVAAALPQSVSSAPLDLVRDILQKNGLVAGNADIAVERSLEALGAAHPQWAECWLELGHLRSDQGRSDEALDCYQRAASARTFSDQIGGPGPLAQARLACARIFVARGDHDAALREYEAALAAAPNQPMTNIEYATLLRQSGRTVEAVSQFATGVQYDWPSWATPKTGRDARRLRFSELLVGPPNHICLPVAGE